MTDRSAGGPWPVEIRVRRAERALEVDFDDGTSFRYPAELLRVESPSAEVQGHSPAQKVTLAGKRNVGITELEQVGNYAVRIIFDDGHNTGIYSWPVLYRLGRDQELIWATYEAALAAKGLSR
jgi:DUF971 family protein